MSQEMTNQSPKIAGTVRSMLYLFILLISSPAMAIETITVLVGLSQNADSDPNIDILDVIEELNTGMPIILARSAILTKQFIFVPYPSSVSYSEPANITSIHALDYIKDKSDLLFAAARDVPIPILAPGGFDVVVMITSKLNPLPLPPQTAAKCGIARSNLFNMTDSNGNQTFISTDKETHAHIVISNSENCRDRFVGTFAHEFGHMVGGEHEIENDDNGVPDGVDYNHVYTASISPQLTYKTIMAETANSSV